MFETILSYASIALIIVSSVFIWRIYQITKSQSMLWLSGSFIYLAIARTIIVLWDPGLRNLMLIPFYIVLTIGMWSFLKMIKKYINHQSKPTGIVNKIKNWLWR